MAQRLMDAVLDQELGPHPQQSDLFDEWRAELGYGTESFNAQEYNRRVAEALVLARLGALLHDFTHVPLGHALEDDLQLLVAHDSNISRLERLWSQFDEGLRRDLGSEGLTDFLKPLIVARSKDGDDLTQEIPRFRIPSDRAREIPRCSDKERWYDFVRDIIGNTICADLLDYLRRDHLFAGLPMAVGDRYLVYFYVTPIRGQVHYPARMVLRIHRGGRERPDVVTELLKHLRYRYELSERALVHHAKLAADAMIGKALEMWADSLWREYALAQADEEELKRETDIGVLKTRFGEVRGRQAKKAIDSRVADEIEAEVSRRGDDSFLEWLRDETEAEAAKREDDETRDKRRAAVHTLAAEILDRHLFKRVGVQADVPISPEDFRDRYGTNERRREYEEDAADFADISHSWKVLTWIPAHTMRLKVAGVLVDDDAEIRRFVDHERRGDERGADIYRDHLHLWAVHVFVDQSVPEKQREVVLARLASRMGVRFPELEVLLGPQPADWPEMLAAVRVCKKRPAAGGRARELFDYVQGQRAARGPAPPKFGLLEAEYEEAAKTLLDRTGA